MPLQLPSHRLLHSLLKSVHILEQKVMHQALGNTTPFTFLLYPYISIRGEQLAVQLKCGLPCLRCLGGGRCARPDLSLWLLNDNTLRWLRGSPGNNIARTGRGLLDNTLPFSSSSEGEGGRRLTSALRWLLLRCLPCPGHKTINGHGFSDHHVFTTVRFDVR